MQAAPQPVWWMRPSAMVRSALELASTRNLMALHCLLVGPVLRGPLAEVLLFPVALSLSIELASVQMLPLVRGAHWNSWLPLVQKHSSTWDLWLTLTSLGTSPCSA